MNKTLQLKKICVRTEVCQCPWGEGEAAQGSLFPKGGVPGVDEDALVAERAHGLVLSVERLLTEAGLVEDGEDFALVFCECAQLAHLLGLTVTAFNKLVHHAKPYDEWFVQGTKKAEQQGDAQKAAVVICELGEAEGFYDWLRQQNNGCAAEKYDEWAFLSKQDFEELRKLVHAGDSTTAAQG